MTTPRDSVTLEGRLSWLVGAYTQVNERRGALECGQDALRAETYGEFNRLRADMNR